MKKIIIYLILSIIIIYLLKLAITPVWNYHLAADHFIYKFHVMYYLEHGVLGGLPGNMYLPGATLFFMIVWAISQVLGNLDYILALNLVNIFFIIIIALLYKKYQGDNSILIYSLVLLFMGPVVFFRFDLFTFFWMILALILWQKSKQSISMILLGFATLVKLFPLVLLGYFLIITYKNKGLKTAAKYFLYYLLGIFLPLGLYMQFFQVTIQDLQQISFFHAMRPISVENIWGSLITLIFYFSTGQFIKGYGDWGTFGIDPKNFILPLWFYSNFWIIPTLILYIWFFKSKIKDEGSIFIKRCAMLVLTFLFFYKSITPQYFLWFMLLLPLLNISIIFRQVRWLIILILILTMSGIYQYIYPLNYTLYIGFYTDGSNQHLFWINFLRNILLIIILVILALDLKNNKTAA